MSLLRSSGILLHPTSLPGPFGIGDLGNEAYRFADFLIASGQSLWQMLPLGPTGTAIRPMRAIRLLRATLCSSVPKNFLRKDC